VVAVNRPVFVIGERAPAAQLVEVLGTTPTLQPVPPNRLLPDLLAAVERYSRRLPVGTDLAPQGLHPEGWYGDFQVAQLRGSGKPRTVEFSGLSILRLCRLFPWGQFVVVRRLSRAIPPSRRPPGPELDKILEVDSQTVDGLDTLEWVLAFLGEPTGRLTLDLTDDSGAGLTRF
jgi:hypothetical protein